MEKAIEEKTVRYKVIRIYKGKKHSKITVMQKIQIIGNFFRRSPQKKNEKKQALVEKKCIMLRTEIFLICNGH